MFILCPKGSEDEGVYSVSTKNGPILIIFECKDDAERYVLHLEEYGCYLSIIEVDAETVTEMCEINDYAYSIVSKDDLVLPIEE